MLDRVSGTTLIKSVILFMSACVVLMLAMDSWQAWDRLAITGRIANIADASANAFKAMHNLRTDRATTNRSLNANDPIDSEAEKYLRSIRDSQMPAMRKAAEILADVDFADKKTLLPELVRLTQSLTTMQTEHWEAVAKPKASRRRDAREGLHGHDRHAAAGPRQDLEPARRRRPSQRSARRPASLDQGNGLAPAQHGG